MKKILSILMTLCLLSGLFAAPAMAITSHSGRFADAVEELTELQYGEFTELVELLCALENPSELEAAFNSALSELTPEERQRIVVDGFSGNDPSDVVDVLVNYAEFADLSETNLGAYYPLSGGTNKEGFLIALNAALTPGSTYSTLEEYLSNAFDTSEDVYEAVISLKKMLNVTMVSEVVQLKIFEPTTTTGDLVLDEAKVHDMLGLINDPLVDTIEDDARINAAINRFVDYYNDVAPAADCTLIYNYLIDNGWVTEQTTSGGGGGGSLPIEEPVEEAPDNPDPQDELEDESAVEIEAEVATEDGTATAEVEVDGDTIEDALDKALETAAALEEGADGRELQPVLVLEAVCELEEGDVLREVDMSLPLEELQAAEEEGVQIAVKTDLGTVVFNTEDIINGSRLGEGEDPQLELSMITVDADAFADQDIPEDALIVDMKFEVNGTELSHFAAPIKVKIPYVLKDGESPEDVTVFWIDETGTPVPVGGVYNPATGMVTFLTDHFSKYYAQVATREFSDVAASHWGHDFVANMAGKGFISGYKDGTFRPNGEITRAEYVTILVQMYALNGDVSGLGFDDVATGAWYAPYVAAGYDNGIIAGKSATEFDPNGKISRQEAAAMLSNVMNLNGFNAETNTDLLDQFADQTEISDWARTSVCNSYAHGLFSGRTDGCFAPKDNLSRVEAATMLFNLLNLK